MHIICDHYEDYFELTGESLLKVSDEITESVHSRYRLFEERHGYACNKKGTSGPEFLKCIKCPGSIFGHKKCP